METQAMEPPLTAHSRFRTPAIQEMGLLLVVLILGAILTWFGHARALPGRPNTFLNIENLVGGVATSMSIYAIMAMGMTCVIITGGIDISVGAAMALSALGGAYALQLVSGDLEAARAVSAWVALPIGIGVPLLIGLLCGLLNGALIVGLKMHPFIVTLGTMSVFRCLATVLPPQVTLPVGGKYLPTAFTDGFMRAKIAGLAVMPMLVMLACAAATWVFLSLLVMGRETYAVGSNETAARFSGLRVNWIKLRVYAISGLCAGLAGMVSLGRFGTASSNSATGYELTVVAAAVVGGASLSGGRGTALGALLGTLIISMLENGILIAGWKSEYGLGIIGGAIIAAVALERASETIRSRRRNRAA